MMVVCVCVCVCVVFEMYLRGAIGPQTSPTVIEERNSYFRFVIFFYIRTSFSLLQGQSSADMGGIYTPGVIRGQRAYREKKTAELREEPW